MQALALLSGLLMACTTPAAELSLRLLETSDLHMNLLAWDYYQDKPTTDYGLARTITLIKAARAEVKNSLLIDNGDLLQGSPLGDQVARIQPLKPGTVHPAYKVLNAIGVDAANIGNHEFNYGLPFLRQALAGAAFPYVNANVYLAAADGRTDSGVHAFTPYVLLDRTLTDDDGARHTLKIGVIGLVPPQIMVWDRAALTGKLVVRDMLETAQRYVPEMRARGAQVVVLVPHSGFERSESTPKFAENSVARLAEVPGVDAILFGHSHAEFPGQFFAAYPKADVQRGTINGVPAVMPGFWGSHLGVVDLRLDNRSGAWRVSSGRAELWSTAPAAKAWPLPTRWWRRWWLTSTRPRCVMCAARWRKRAPPSPATSPRWPMTRRCSWWPMRSWRMPGARCRAPSLRPCRCCRPPRRSSRAAAWAGATTPTLRRAR